MDNKIFAYMRISTNHQKTDRQKQTIIEYSVNNGFNINEFVSDTITGGTKADSRPNYHNMKKQLRNGDTLMISDVDRLGRNEDDVILEIKDLQSKGIRVVALDVPFLNDWEKICTKNHYYFNNKSDEDAAKQIENADGCFRFFDFYAIW